MKKASPIRLKKRKQRKFQLDIWQTSFLCQGAEARTLLVHKRPGFNKLHY